MRSYRVGFVRLQKKPRIRSGCGERAVVAVAGHLLDVFTPVGCVVPRELIEHQERGELRVPWLVEAARLGVGVVRGRQRLDDAMHPASCHGSSQMTARSPPFSPAV